MGNRRIVVLLACMLSVSMLAACGLNPDLVASTSTDSPVATDVTNETAGAGADSAAEALAENSRTHAEAEDYIWDSAAVVQIALEGSSITADGDGVTVDGSRATITSAGTYRLSGSLADGQVSVDTDDEGIVRLILDGVDIGSSTSAPINVIRADETIIVLADNAENHVADAETYLFDVPDEDEPNAAIFSKSDLTIYGNGSLTVTGNYNDGIASKDGLIIAGGTITISSVDDGIRGKDYLVVQGGNITVTAQGDGLKSDDEEDAAQGYISIEAGVISIISGGDAIEAATDVTVTGGEITLTSGGGSHARIAETTSAKGIKAAVNVNIDGGTFAIDSADDALNSNGSLVINGGAFVISSGDDGLHADSTLDVNGGDIRITESYEGIESAVITINAGDLHIASSDDGLNVAGGKDSSGMNPGMGPGRGPGGGPGQDAFAYSGDYYLYINGGYIVIEAAGDGIDVNGAIAMTAGVVIVNGPTERMNGALDYDAGFSLTGGFLVAAGSSGMAQAPGASSSQSSLLLNFTSTQPAGTLVHIQNSAGEEVLTFAPIKEYQSIAFASPELVQGAAYEVYTGGSSTGTAIDGLYRDGTYTPGAQYTRFTVSSVVTRVGGNSR